MAGSFIHRCSGLATIVGISALAAAMLVSGCTKARPEPRPSETPRSVTITAEPEFPSQPVEEIGDWPDMVPGQLVVKLEEAAAFQAMAAEPQADGIVATGIDDIDHLNQAFGVTDFEPLIKPVAQAQGESVSSMAARKPAMLGLYVVTYEAEIDSHEVAAAYQLESNVLYAEPNFYAYASDGLLAPPAFDPNDPYFNRQWNMAAIQMPQAWDMSNGQQVVVAVLDTGIAYENFEAYRQAPDLSSTRFVAGYDFVNQDPHANDDGGHGTHVAGTIAQSTNNGQGVAGVAFGATLMPVKVLDSRGQGSFDGLAQGIMYAADRGAKVINMSLSGRQGSMLLADAVNYASSKGSLVVAASGNSGGPIEFPAYYDSTLAVGAVDFEQDRARYSNYGPQLDVVAPGGDTGSDRNGDGYPDGILQQTFKRGSPGEFDYYYLEGTSMAAPHVSGLAALLFSLNPNATAGQVRQAIEASALDLGAAGRDNDYGWGLVQAANALAAMGGIPPTATVPALPTPTPSPSSIPPVVSPSATPVSPTPGSPTSSPTPTSQVPSETLTPVAPISTPTMAGYGNLIVNGGFEANTGWVFGPTPRRAAYASEVVHSGSRSMRLGTINEVDIYSYSSIWQTVAIPADARRATLSYWTYPISWDTYPRDLQMVLLLDEHFHVVSHLDQSLSNAQHWIPGSFDLTPWAGQTLTVYFGVYNSGGTGLPSAMYVDDVELSVER